MPPAYDMFGAERKQRRPTGLYRNNGALAEAFRFNDGDRARRKFTGRRIVKNRLRVFEASPEIHEGQGGSRQAIGSFAGKDGLNCPGRHGERTGSTVPDRSVAEEFLTAKLH